MIRALSLAFFMVGAAVQSADIPVRTGEHGQFTRIFLSGPEATNWGLVRSGDSYLVALPNGVEMDLEFAFERIDRTRIKDMAQEDRELAIHLNCDCGARSFPIEGQGLVIDISEEFPVAEIAPPPIAATTNFSVLDWKLHRQNTTATMINSALDAFEAESEPMDTSSARQNFLISDVATAATQGGLEAAKNFSPIPDGGGATSSATEQIRLSRDAFNQSVAPIATTLDEVVCEKETDFSIASWGNPAMIYSGISEARRNLIDEAGEVDTKWLQKLVLAHIYAGQGKEANAILSSFPTIESKDVLSSISQLVEHRGLPQGPSAVAKRLEDSACHTGLEMWQTLSGHRQSAAAKNKVLIEFSNLPMHLRLALGPALIDAFIRENDMISANLARSALDRLDGPVPSELKEVYARMHEQLGEDEPAKEIYNELLRAGEVGAPKVAERLVDMASESDGDLLAGTTDLIDALSFEYQGTNEGQTLTSAAIKGLILDDDLAAAIDALTNNILSEADWLEIEERLFQKLSGQVSPQEVVHLYVHNPQYFLTATKSQKIRVHVGETLAEAGFTLQAEKLGVSHGEATETAMTDNNPPLSESPVVDEITGTSANLVVRGDDIISQSQSIREDIASLLSDIR